MQRFVSSLVLTGCLWGAADFPYLAAAPIAQAQISILTRNGDGSGYTRLDADPSAIASIYGHNMKFG